MIGKNSSAHLLTVKSHWYKALKETASNKLNLNQSVLI